MRNKAFDINLRQGIAAENMLRELLGPDASIEVKRDFEVSNTGNVAIEYKCRGRKSGLATTKAEWWAITLDGPCYGHDVIVLIRTSRLKELGRKLYEQGRWRSGGDEGSDTRFVLINVGELVTLCPGNFHQPRLI